MVAPPPAIGTACVFTHPLNPRYHVQLNSQTQSACNVGLTQTSSSSKSSLAGSWAAPAPGSGTVTFMVRTDAAAAEALHGVNELVFVHKQHGAAAGRAEVRAQTQDLGRVAHAAE